MPSIWPTNTPPQRRFVRERHPFILIENHAHVVVSRKRLPLIKKSHQRRFVRERLPFVQKPRQRWLLLVEAFHCSNLKARRRGVSREHLSFAQKTTTETIKGRHKDSKRPIIKRSHQRRNKGHHKKTINVITQTIKAVVNSHRKQNIERRHQSTPFGSFFLVCLRAL